MKRSRIKRRTPLKRVNKSRLKDLRSRQFGPQANACRSMPCAACGKAPPSDPAHVRSRGAGGLDHANVVPLCRKCHIEQGSAGIKTFQARHRIDMKAIAEEIAESLQED